MRYPVTLTPDDGAIVVTFPDVPEAISYGDTIDEALSRASDALMTIFDAFMKDRRDIPEPSVGKGATSIELPSLEAVKIALYRTMRATGVNKSELARRLKWHLPQVDRVLDVHHGSQLDQIEAAFGALGKRLVVSIEDRPFERVARRRPVSSDSRPRRRRNASASASARGARSVASRMKSVRGAAKKR